MPIDWQKYFNANRLAKIAKILAKVTSRTSGDRRCESQNFGNVKVHKYTCTCCRHIFLNFKATGGNVLVVCASERGTFVRCWNFPEQTTTNFLAASARLLPKFWHFRWKHITTSLQILGACTPTKVTMASKNMKLLRGCDPRNTENWHPTCPSTIHTFSKHIFLDSARKIVQIRLFFDFVCEVICLSPALPFMTSLHHISSQMQKIFSIPEVCTLNSQHCSLFERWIWKISETLHEKLFLCIEKHVDVFVRNYEKVWMLFDTFCIIVWIGQVFAFGESAESLIK